ncbi:M15 family metallopeptidase [Intestinibacillus massiliensis]|nr:M15 family metallopeptidase [Intestinibacillus massiliensis]
MRFHQALGAALALAAALSCGTDALALTNISTWAVPEVTAAQKADLEPSALQKKAATGSITREEFCGIALRLYESVTGKTVGKGGDTPFADTDSPDVAAAYALGLVSGRGEGVFDPDGLITRQELCKTLDNIIAAAGLEAPPSDPEALSEYPDRDEVASWAEGAVARMLDSGVMRGVSRLQNDETGEAHETVTLSPGGKTTREQALMLSLRFTETFERAPDPEPEAEPNRNPAQDPEPAVPGKKPSDAFNDMKDFVEGGNLPAQGDGKAMPSPLPETEAQKMAFIFGVGGTYFETVEEAEAAMAEIEVPVWRLQDDGSKKAGTAYVTVNRALAPLYRAVFQEIFDGDEQFPIKDVGSYAWRPTPTSEHRWGTAIDINYDENMEATINADGTLTPTTGTHWAPGEDPYSIPEGGDVYRAFTKYGFSWGGNAWRSKRDYMHFSYFGR